MRARGWLQWSVGWPVSGSYLKVSFEQRPGAGRVPRRSGEAHGLQVGLIPRLGLEPGSWGSEVMGQLQSGLCGPKGPGFALGERVNAAVGRGRP